MPASRVDFDGADVPATALRDGGDAFIVVFAGADFMVFKADFVAVLFESFLLGDDFFATFFATLTAVVFLAGILVAAVFPVTTFFATVFFSAGVFTADFVAVAFFDNTPFFAAGFFATDFFVAERAALVFLTAFTVLVVLRVSAVLLVFAALVVPDLAVAMLVSRASCPATRMRRTQVWYHGPHSGRVSATDGVSF